MAGSSSSVSWTPAPGRHAVNIGPSLGKALKARKLKASPGATATTKRSALPERDFYSFRFNFKPPSIDTTKPASIEIQKSADNTKVLAEYPSDQSGEAHIFLGAEQSAREVDCVLIYDEDTGTYTLEKLDSFVNLRYDRKTIVSPRPSPAPTPVPKAAPPVQKTTKTTKGKGKQRQPVDDLERDLLGLDEDAEGDIDNSVEPIKPKPIIRKEEEEEEEELPVPPKLSHPIPAKPQLPPPKARPVKPIPKSRVAAKVPTATSQPSRQKLSPPPPPPNAFAPIPAPKTRPAQKKEQARPREPVQQTGLISKKELTQKKEPIQKKESVQKKEPVQKEKKAKPLPAVTPAPPIPAPYVDEEVIEFGRPAKRLRPSTPQRTLLPPTPPATVILSLPGGSNSFAPPPPPPGSQNSRGTGSFSRDVPPPAVPAALSLPTSVPASPPMMGQYSDEEEDWDEVSTANLASASLAPSNSNSNDNNPETYDVALEQDIFGDEFVEVDGDDASAQPYVDGDGEEEEIDMNAFEQELNEHMEVADDSDDDDFGGLDVELEADLQGGGTRQPISLNRLASGGVGVDMSDEDYSSSDDSDED